MTSTNTKVTVTHPSFIQRLRAIDAEGSDPAQIARMKAGLIGQWLLETPQDFLSELRNDAPVFPTPLFTIVTRYRDVLEIFHADQVFTIDAFQSKVLRDIGPFILGMKNSPEYERQKSILRLAFPREDAPYFRQIVIEESNKLLEQIAASQTFDLISQYARLLPALTMRRYLGLEEIPTEKILAWSRPIFRDIFANITNDAQIEQAASTARTEAVTVIDTLIARRYAQLTGPETPKTVLDRFLVMQAIAATRLSDEDIRNCLLAFFVAAVDLTSIAITKAVEELLNRPEIMAEARTVQDGDDAIAAYVWEALRFRPPTVGLFRLCTEDYTLAKGTPDQAEIKQGTLVYAASAAAMHDERQIDAPTEFRVGRSQASYLFFESGIHSCLGKYFSMVQIPLALQGLLKLGDLQGVRPLHSDRGFPESWPMKVVGRL